MVSGEMESRSQLCRTVGEVIHSDVCGPIHTISLGGALYFVTFVDEASGHVTVKFLKSKGEAAAELINYIKWIERQTGNRVNR